MTHSKAASMTSNPAVSQGDKLRTAFQHTVDVLKRRRADQLSATDIDAYVARDWLAWRGGSLKLTIVGENICRQLRDEAFATAAP